MDLMARVLLFSQRIGRFGEQLKFSLYALHMDTLSFSDRNHEESKITDQIIF